MGWKNTNNIKITLRILKIVCINRLYTLIREIALMIKHKSISGTHIAKSISGTHFSC